MTTSYMPDSDSEDELPPHWEESATDDGLVCFTNQQTKIKQWTHPRTGRTKRVIGDCLPLGWDKKTEENGNRMLFYNSNTNQRTYVDPRLAFAIEEPPINVSQVRQRFDSSTTALQILHGKDLNGRLAILTGANVGIGFETARSLCMHGCSVIFACRNRQTTEEAIERICQEKSSIRDKCRFVELDLASFSSVQAFIDVIKQNVRHIDYLILNAGVFALPYTITVDGFESTFQICHLSHFHITLQLESLFDHSTRIVILSSESHRFSSLPTVDLTEQHLSPPPQKYWSMMAYNNAKLCNILFCMELARRWKHRCISVFAVHPGNMVSSQLARNWWFYRLLFALVRPFTKSLQQASATTVYCATANELTGLSGHYFNNCYIHEASKTALDSNLAKQLWNISEGMVQRILEVTPKK